MADPHRWLADTMTRSQSNPIVDEALLSQADAILARATGERKTIRHAGMRGSSSEALLRGVLASCLPGRVGIETGVLYDHKGETSGQTDIILFDRQGAALPPSVSGTIPCESGLASIEVKTTLRTSHLKKAGQDAKRVKLLELTCHNTATDHGHGQEPQWQHGTIPPHMTNCTLLGIFGSSPLETVARYWRKHYYDVPFGCQLDYIVCLESGVICLAAWHPRTGRRRDQYTPVYYVHPGHCNPDGQSVLLFPDWSGESKYPKSVRVGPRVPWAPGSTLFIGWTECGRHALGMWLKVLLECMSVQFAPLHVSSFGHFAEGLPPETKTRFLPLAMTADPNQLDKQGLKCVLRALGALLAWGRSREDVPTTPSGRRRGSRG